MTTRPTSNASLGLVVEAKLLGDDLVGPNCLLLAIDEGENGRHCLAIDGGNSAEWLRGCLVVRRSERSLVTSNHEIRQVLDVVITPEHLGLSPKWLNGQSSR